jgi:hypothetical protein
MDRTEHAKEKRDKIRRAIALLKERGLFALSSVPDQVAEFCCDANADSFCQQLNESNGDLLRVLSIFDGTHRAKASPATWTKEVEQFFNTLGQLEVTVRAFDVSIGRRAEFLSGVWYEVQSQLSQVAMFLRRIEKALAAAGPPAT